MEKKREKGKGVVGVGGEERHRKKEGKGRKGESFLSYPWTIWATCPGNMVYVYV